VTFPDDLESQFRASRVSALAELNGSIYHFSLVAALVLLFSAWDWFADPAAWSRALVIRVIAVAVIVSTGIIQRMTKTLVWAPTIAKIRYAGSVLAVAGANAVVHDGYQIGLAGLVAGFLAAPYIALDRKDYLKTALGPLVVVAIIMFAEDLDRFTIINAWVFLALTIMVGLLLARVLETANRRAFAAEQALMREARTDALTGLANRRSMEEFAAAELKRQGRFGKPMAVILCDVDYFKKINDEKGHDIGDQTIRAVAENLHSVIRATDALGRWGGEEFLAILPETSENDAVKLGERMRAAVEFARMPSGEPITISLGVSAVTQEFAAQNVAAFDDVMKAADEALYRAKAEGRNRVVRAHALELSK
jgi:diguanylate cyclase (GGDEF)-like protein